MSTGLDWRVVLYWTKVGVACVALLAVVIAIGITPGFPDILLTLVAASLWSLISLFFIFLVTNNRGYEHWILHVSFEISNIAVDFIAFLVVLVFIYVPSLDGHIPTAAGKSLSLFSAALTLILCVIWISSAIILVINARKEIAHIQQQRRQDMEIQHTQTTKWPTEVPKKIRTTETTTETDSSSRGSRSRTE